MNPSAHYKTLHRFWDGGNLVGKKLTDARIRYYQERGRYGPEHKQQQKEKVARKSHSTLAKLMKEFS